jgi:hypothetical protein
VYLFLAVLRTDILRKLATDKTCKPRKIRRSISQKTELFLTTGVRTTNPTKHEITDNQNTLTEEERDKQLVVNE